MEILWNMDGLPDKYVDIDTCDTATYQDIGKKDWECAYDRRVSLYLCAIRDFLCDRDS